MVELNSPFAEHQRYGVPPYPVLQVPYALVSDSELGQFVDAVVSAAHVRRVQATLKKPYIPDAKQVAVAVPWYPDSQVPTTFSVILSTAGNLALV